MTAVPALAVGRWRLRGLVDDDAAPWRDVIHDPELRRLTSWPALDVDDVRRLIADYVSGPRAATTRRWAIVDDDGAFAGTCGFKDWDKAAGTAELSYELALRHRGRGAMSAIAGAVVDHGFDVMGLGGVSALVNVENAASARLLEKLGFRKAALLPAFRVCGGALRDFQRYERGR